MSADSRSALLLLGLFLNEANWLRKLLVKAVLGTNDSPDGQANFALTMLLATTLAGKVHEGWDRIVNGKLAVVLDQLSLPDELKGLKDAISVRLSEPDPLAQQTEKGKKPRVFLRIRNNIGFHYADRKFDFSKLAEHLSDTDTVLYMTTGGFGGDVLSHISTLAGLEPLLALDADADYRIALKNVWEEVTEVTGMYCRFISDAMATLIMASIPNLSSENFTISNASNAMEGSIEFFVHPPENLEEMQAQVISEAQTKQL